MNATPIRYGSVCSGIEAATVAWEPLGWKAQWFSELDKFPSAVLAHHYPGIHNYGDFTTITEDAPGIDLLVGGTPCQSFSLAGLRKGMADKRGVLALEFLKLASRVRPTWVVWENVPGVLSSNGGRDFGSFLGGLVQLGYGFAYRVLDAQYFGVPQRRRRVFVVGHLGDWRRAAAVLFERESLSRHNPPRRGEGQAVTGRPEGSPGRGRGPDGNSGRVGHPTAYNLNFISKPDGTFDYKVSETDTSVCLTRQADDPYGARGGTIVAFELTRGGPGSDGDGRSYTAAEADVAPCLGTDSNPTCNQGGLLIPDRYPGSDGGQLAQTLRANAGALRPHQGDTAIVEVLGVDLQGGKGSGRSFTDTCPTLGADAANMHAILEGPALFPRQDQLQWKEPADATAPLTCTNMHNLYKPAEGQGPTRTSVRRLTPTECERLQGFPDGYTLIPWKGKDAPDGRRYKALGNSMATPVMAFIGRRIQEVHNL